MGRFDQLKGQIPAELIQALENETVDSDSQVDAVPADFELTYSLARDKICHIYANSATGDDANDGLTSDNAKLTVQAAFDAIPHSVEGIVIVHLSGNFEYTAVDYHDKGMLIANRHSSVAHDKEAQASIVVMGDDALSVVDDNGGSNYASTGVTTSSITITGAGWTEDQFIGRVVELVDTDQAGVIRGVHHNTTDTVYFTNTITLPSGNPQFRFVEPATTIRTYPSALPGDTWGRTIGAAGLTGGYYYSVNFQRLTLIDCGVYSGSNPGIHFWACNIVQRIESAEVRPFSTNYEKRLSGGGVSSGLTVNPVDGTHDIASRWYLSFGVVSNSTSVVELSNADRVGLFSLVSNGTVIARGCGVAGLEGRFTGLLIQDCRRADDIDQSYSRIQIGRVSGSSGVGIRILDSDIAVQEGDFAGVLNSTSHGILVDHSNVEFDGIPVDGSGGDAIQLIRGSHVKFKEPITGSGNTGFSLNVGDGCHAILENTNTITSTAGEISFDGTNEATTFTSVEGGTPAAVWATHSLVRNATEVPVVLPDCKCLGSIYAADQTTATTFSGSGEANKSQVLIFTSNGLSINATPDYTQGHITVASSGYFLVHARLNMKAASSVKAGVVLYKNNGATRFDGSHTHENLGASIDSNTVYTFDYVELEVGDTVEVWIYNDTSSADITVEDINLGLERKGP